MDYDPINNNIASEKNCIVTAWQRIKDNVSKCVLFVSGKKRTREDDINVWSIHDI
jgi:hypothetical protein